MVWDSRHLVFISLIILLIEIVVMIFWKEYNRIRFGRKNRRKFRPDVSKEEIAEIMHTTPENIDQIQKRKVIVFEKNVVPEELHWTEKGRENRSFFAFFSVFWYNISDNARKLPGSVYMKAFFDDVPVNDCVMKISVIEWNWTKIHYLFVNKIGFSYHIKLRKSKELQWEVLIMK